MSNQIEIINLGLSQVKGGFIENLAEASREAQIANRIYDMCRDAALTDVSPRWARKQAALALTVETVNGWDFVYTYPSDCIDAIEIYNPAKTHDEDKIPFEIGSNNAATEKTILCNSEQAELIYTRKVTNTGMYDQLFVEALAWKLSAYFAIPLKGDDKLQAACAQAYARAIAIAKTKTKNEGWKTPDSTSSFQRAR